MFLAGVEYLPLPGAAAPVIAGSDSAAGAADGVDGFLEASTTGPFLHRTVDPMVDSPYHRLAFDAT